MAARYRTSNRRWAIAGSAAFVLLAFAPIVSLKGGSYSVWEYAWRLLNGSLGGPSSEHVKLLLFYSAMLLLPAAALGWATQGIVVEITSFSARCHAAEPIATADGGRDSPSSPVSRYVVGLFAPWLILGIGTAGLMAFRDDHIAESLWFLLRIVCMLVILVLLVASVWSLTWSAPRRRSAWSWGFLVGCFVNMILFWEVGWRG